MRKMSNDCTTLNIVKHIILKNGWEYYVTDNKFDSNIVQCLVMGDFTEIGDVYLPEITPFILSQSERLDEILPAEGWKWT